MSSENELPLVSFVVMAFNQEKFIRSAIEGAFSQTYPSLEIILSDDCSSDRTFGIMQEMAAEYEGFHDIVLNRNLKNLGFVPHIDRVMDIARGNFIVANAGDDISMPERAEILADTWLRAPEDIMLVHSPVQLIDVDGFCLGEHASPKAVIDDPTPFTIAAKGLYILGASLAWNRKVFDEFGPLGSGISVEDRIIPFRAALLGEIHFVPKQLLKYRTGGLSTSHSKHGPTHDYMYGLSHKLRKWNSENDFYILSNFQDVSFPDKKQIMTACSKRAPILHFAVKLADMGIAQRWCMLPCALFLSIQHRKLLPLKQWAQYACEPVYVRYANQRALRRQVMQGQAKDI